MIPNERSRIAVTDAEDEAVDTSSRQLKAANCDLCDAAGDLLFATSGLCRRLSA